jgi:hypothetical protein
MQKKLPVPSLPKKLYLMIIRDVMTTNYTGRAPTRRWFWRVQETGWVKIEWKKTIRKKEADFIF